MKKLSTRKVQVLLLFGCLLISNQVHCQSATKNDFGLNEEGKLKVECYKYKELDPIVTIDFEGSIEFRISPISSSNVEKGAPVSESNSICRPSDPQGAFDNLIVSDLRLRGETGNYIFLDKELVEEGFYLRWKNENNEQEYISACVSWDKLGRNFSLDVIVLCKLNDLSTMSSLDKNTIAKAQEKLIRSGLLSGEADGIAGKQTHTALLEYQKLHKLPISGDLDHATRFFLDIQ